ncbi:hypothetical protein BH23ACT3_BH23ACT3_01330 [soil metagenome]
MIERDSSFLCGVPSPALRYVRLAVAGLAVLVPIQLLRLVTRSSLFSRFDYFEMVPTILDGDGSVIWSGLLVHQNEHLLALPKIVYLANIWAFDGSNVTLGVFVWLVAGGVAVVLGLALRTHLPTNGWNLAVVTWLFAVYLFPLQAQHNFRLAMSGTAWILANLFAVAAIALLVRERPVAAAAAGGLATLTYGTGLAVWPALALVVLLRRRFGRGEAALVGVGMASIALQRLTAEPGRSAFYDWSPISVVRSMAITLGGLFTDDTRLAVLIGLGIAAVGVAAIVRLGPLVTADGPLVLVAMMTFTSFGLVLFGISRSALGDATFTASRYMAFAALFVLATSLLGLLAFGQSIGYRVLVMVVAVASLIASTSQTERFDAMTHAADLSMVAAYMGAGVGVVPLYSKETDAAFRAVGHIPFNGGFAHDCGLFGERLDPSLVSTDDPVAGEILERRQAPTHSPFLQPVPVDEIPAFHISGSVIPVNEVECLVIRDADSHVTGVGLLDPTVPVDVAGGCHPTGQRRWSAYVESDSPDGEVLVKLRGDDRFHVIDRLPDE